MMPNHYDRERMAQAHRQDLLREAAHERLLAQLSQSRRGLSLLSPVQLKLYWRALRMRVQQGFQRRTA
jgi:hypothetical protein